jgi:hypothetical protein
VSSATSATSCERAGLLKERQRGGGGGGGMGGGERESSVTSCELAGVLGAGAHYAARLNYLRQYILKSLLNSDFIY